MKRFPARWAAVPVVAVAITLLPAIASADEASLKISGGGTATFDDFDGGTVFSVQMQIDADGHVRGHFFCQIAGVVAIIGDDLREAVLHEDGSVELYGFAHGFDVAVGVFEDMPFAVQLWPGRPGVGRFIYDDPVVGPSGGVDLDEGDHETVASGYILFQQD
jgi:hypothetical protein